jgi:hypothetical protein
MVAHSIRKSQTSSSLPKITLTLPSETVYCMEKRIKKPSKTFLLVLPLDKRIAKVEE